MIGSRIFNRMTAALVLTALVLTALVLTAATASAQSLTIAEARSRAEAGNPSLMAAGRTVAAADARIGQAARRPNPALELEWEDWAGSGPYGGTGASAATFLISQSFELGGKRGHRSAAAREQRNLGEWDRRAALLDLRLRVEQEFTAAWAAQEHLRLAGEILELDRQLVQDIGSRVEAGASSRVDLSRARSRSAMAEVDHRRAGQELESAKRRLAILWGDFEPDFDSVVGDLEDFTVSDPPADLRRQASGNPDVARWRTVEALRGSVRDLARAAGKPDLDLGLGIRRYNESGDHSLVLGASLPLPLFDNNKDEIRAADHELRRAGLMAEATLNEVCAKAASALRDRRSSLDEIHALDDRIIPRAAEAFTATREGHGLGLFSCTDVIETRRFICELRKDRLEAVVRFHLADARLERLLGGADQAAAPATGVDSND